MNQRISLLMAQINPTVAAIKSNSELIINIIKTHQDSHDIIIFPELALTGYPPEDFLLRNSFYAECETALASIARVIENCHVIIGHPYLDLENGKRFNSASIYYQKQRIHLYHKQELPNYGVFDELRYFNKGEAKACIFTVKGLRLGLCICEDLWAREPIEPILRNSPDAIISINASPFDKEKYQNRLELLQSYAKLGLAIFYVNLVGGQDELVFDGQSFAMDASCEVRTRAKAFAPELLSLSFEHKQIQGPLATLKSPVELLYDSLVLAIRDFVEKNHFPGVILGLSGGIDSALTLAIATDALGPSRVQALMMPSRHTASISMPDAEQELESLDVKGHLISIEPIYTMFLQTLQPFFANKVMDITEENLQARIRCLILMAFANKEKLLVLTTSNKSETAVGYTTIYGDMAGGFAVLKDVFKTEVYALANYRNSLTRVIPDRVLKRPPSAELSANQTDQDSLPDYPTLDAILSKYMEQGLDKEALIQQGFNKELVDRILRLIRNSEHKRHQAAPGPKVSQCAFGKDWRFPITAT